MSELKKWQFDLKADRMVSVLNHKGFNAMKVSTLAEAKDKVLEIIPENAVIGLGGSVTVSQMDILETLRSQKYQLIDRYKCTSAQHNEFYRKALLSDYFLTGANAITESGEIVATDCSGNRVSAMMFGPERVIIVVGANKLVKNIDAAMARIKEIAPMNSKRNNHKTPCAQTGICGDCNTPARMCNYTGIIHSGMKCQGRTTVIVIADEVGF